MPRSVAATDCLARTCELRCALNHLGNSKTRTRRTPMPLVNVKLIEGVFTPMQKQEMIRKLTDTMVSIEGENLRLATLVVIEEVGSGEWGFGGKPFTADDVKMLAARKSTD